MKDPPDDDLAPADRISDVPRITRALEQAVREALWQHKINGRSIVVWRNGRVEWIPPDQIPVTDPALDNDDRDA